MPAVKEKNMSLGLRYKNDEKILEERVVNGVPLLVYPLLEICWKRPAW